MNKGFPEGIIVNGPETEDLFRGNSMTINKRELRVWTVFLWTVVLKSENEDLGRLM